MVNHPPWHPEIIQTHSSLRNSIKTDVAIIGAGITGASAAYHLSHAGIKCVVLEAKNIAAGASGRNLGTAVPGIEHDFVEAVNRFGFAKARSAWMETIDSLREIRRTVLREKIECGLEHVGHLNVALNEKELDGLKGEITALKKAGIRSKWIEGSDVQNYLNSPNILAMERSPHALNVSTFKLVRGLLQSAVHQGAKIYEKSEAVKVEKIRQEFIIKTRGGEVTAKNVFFATESYTPSQWLPKKLDVIPYHAFVTRPFPEKWFRENWPGNEIFWNFGINYHMFRRLGNRILYSGEELKNPLKALREFFPNLKIDGQQSHKWYCRLAGFKDEWPRIGEHPTKPGVFFSAGYIGHGVTLGFISGQVLRDLISGRKNNSAKLFSP